MSGILTARQRSVWVAVVCVWATCAMFLSGCLGEVDKTRAGNYEPMNWEMSELEYVNPDLLGSQIECYHCRRLRGISSSKVRDVLEQENPRVWSVVELLTKMESNMECFSREEISQVQSRWHYAEYKRMIGLAEHCSDGGVYPDRIEAWHEFPPNIRQQGDAPVFWQPDPTTVEQRHHEILAWNLRCQHKASTYREAMAHALAVEGQRLKQELTSEIVRGFYSEYYWGRLEADQHPDQVEEARIFIETYPLLEFWDPMKLGEEMVGWRSRPALSQQFVKDFGLTDAQRDELVAMHFGRVRYRYDQQVEMAEKYVSAGYDEAYAYGRAAAQLVKYECYSSALRIAHEHLGAREIRRIEDARIAELERTGQYSIEVSPNGQRKRIYPMADN